LRAASEVPLSTLLSTPDCDVHDPQFSPAGTRASVVAALHPDRGRPDLRSTVWLLGGDTAEPLDLPSMDVSRHLWLDGGTVVLVGNALTRDELGCVGQRPGLFGHDLRTGSTRRLTDPETRAVAALRARAVGGGLSAVGDTVA